MSTRRLLVGTLRSAISFSVISVLSVLLASSLLAQVAPSNRSPSGHTLITVSVRPDQLQIQQGDDLGVEVTLTAGPDGAYVPNFFGDFNQTCEKGFWVDIFTAEGKPASEMNNSCVSDELFGGTSARELLAKRYVFLRPRESRHWHTTLTKITKSPGSYEVRAQYISGRQQTQIQEIAALPEVHGLMVLGRVDAESVKVTYRQFRNSNISRCRITDQARRTWYSCLNPTHRSPP